MSGEIIEADHHNEDHDCHCDLGRHHVRPEDDTNGMKPSLSQKTGLS